MSSGTVLYEKKGPVALITLNRPEKMNAAIDGMYKDLSDCFAAADGDADVRVMIVTGAGKAFCEGGVLREMFLP